MGKSVHSTMKKALLKVTILGDSSVGKTSLMNQYVNNKFSKKSKSKSVGADFLSKEIQTEDRLVTLQIWDTPGNQKFQALGPVFYQGADACIIMFDVTCRKSFEAVGSWRDEFCRSSGRAAADSFPFVVIGNKIDLLAERSVTCQEATDWCSSRGVKYTETSAKTKESVDQTFQQIAQLAQRARPDEDNYMITTPVVLSPVDLHDEPPAASVYTEPAPARPVSSRRQTGYPSAAPDTAQRPAGVKTPDSKCRMCASCTLQ